MNIGKSLSAVVFSAAILTPITVAHAQATVQAASIGCTTSQNAAVQCFVANAVATDLTKPRYGMTLAQFESYGVAISQILQTHQTYLVLVAVASAVADAMPPTNANGSANPAAQANAVSEMVGASSRLGFAPTPEGASLIDLEYFSRDITTAMNDNSGVMALLTPGISLRIIDSYIVTSTVNGVVNWNEVNSKLANAVSQLISSGLMKVPPGMTTAQVSKFASELARVIDSYKVATGRKALTGN